MDPPAVKQSHRALFTLADQGVVSVANFVANVVIARYFGAFGEPGKANYAEYTLAFNLMLWIGELHVSIVHTPHTMHSPKLAGDNLRRFHGSTLIQHFILSFLAMVALFCASPFASHWGDAAMGKALIALAIGTAFIGLRNYLRPYQFALRSPLPALVVDIFVCLIQIGGLLALKQMGKLTTESALLTLAIAAGLPSILWLVVQRKRFTFSMGGLREGFLGHWSNTRWILISSLVWNAGMLMYPWLIASIRGKQDVALWGYCYQLAAIGNPMLMGLQSFVGPRIAEAYAERTPREFRHFVYRAGTVTLLLMIGPAVLLCSFSGVLLHWISKGAYSWEPVAIIAISAAIVLQAGTFALSRGLFAIHRGDLDLYANFGPLVVMFALGVPLVKYFGASGAALSLLAAQLMSNGLRTILFRYAFSKHQEPALKIEEPPEMAESLHEL